MRVCLHVTIGLLLVTCFGFTDGSCPAGTFHRVVSNWNSKEWLCIPCAAGGWSPPFNSFTTSLCRSCPVNTYSRMGASRCTPCPYATTTTGTRSWAAYLCKSSSPETNIKNTSTTPEAPTTPKAPTVESDELNGSRNMNSHSTLSLLLVSIVVVIVAVNR